jgi:hypothetical protein
MTPEEHRRLDADIAEKVMGCRVSRHHSVVHCGCATPPFHFDEEGVCITPYSTHIGAAWSVIERMREQGWSISLTLDPGTVVDEKPAWTVVLSRLSIRHDDPSRIAGDTALDAPLAICRAALKAAGTSTE